MQHASDLYSSPRKKGLKHETHTVIAGLLKRQQESQHKNIKQNGPPNLQNDLLRYSTGFNSEEDLASSMPNFSKTHDNTLSKTINSGDYQNYQ